MFAFNYRKMSKRDGTKWISFPFRLRLKVEQKTNCATIIEKEFMEKKMNREFKFVELMEGGFGF